MKGIKPRQQRNEVHETRDLYVSHNTVAQKRSNGPGRIRKACEPCRLKKARCDGKEPCRTYNRTCVFSERHRREIRKWVCDMQSTVDEAIRRLYDACEKADCFPGVLPDSQNGDVTTESILRGLGLDKPDPPLHHQIRPQPQHDGQTRPASSASHRQIDDFTETLLDLTYPRPHDEYSDATTERSSQSPMRSKSVSRNASKPLPLSRTASNSLSVAQTDQKEETRINNRQTQAYQWPTESQFQMQNPAHAMYHPDAFTLRQGNHWQSMAAQNQVLFVSPNASQIQSPIHAMPQDFAPTNYHQHPPFYDMNTLVSPMTGMDTTWPVQVSGEQPMNLMHMNDVRMGYPTQGWHRQQ